MKQPTQQRLYSSIQAVKSVQPSWLISFQNHEERMTKIFPWEGDPSLSLSVSLPDHRKTATKITKISKLRGKGIEWLRTKKPKTLMPQFNIVYAISKLVKFWTKKIAANQISDRITTKQSGWRLDWRSQLQQDFEKEASMRRSFRLLLVSLICCWHS